MLYTGLVKVTRTLRVVRADLEPLVDEDAVGDADVDALRLPPEGPQLDAALLVDQQIVHIGGILQHSAQLVVGIASSAEQHQVEHADDGEGRHHHVLAAGDVVAQRRREPGDRVGDGEEGPRRPALLRRTRRRLSGWCRWPGELRLPWRRWWRRRQSIAELSTGPGRRRHRQQPGGYGQQHACGHRRTRSSQLRSSVRSRGNLGPVTPTSHTTWNTGRSHTTGSTRPGHNALDTRPGHTGRQISAAQSHSLTKWHGL